MNDFPLLGAIHSCVHEGVGGVLSFSQDYRFFFKFFPCSFECFLAIKF